MSLMREFGVVKITLYASLLFTLAKPGQTWPADGTYYISAQGCDTDLGVSPEHPWRSLAKVSSTVLHPGDRVLLRSGDIWFEKLEPKSAGTSMRPITFASYGFGPRPIIDGRNVPVTTGEGLVNIRHQQFIVVTSLDVRDSVANGISVYHADGFHALNCVVRNNRNNGIAIGSSSEILIRGNDIYSNNLSGEQAYSGILVDSWDGGTERSILIESNRIHRNSGSVSNNGNGIKVGHTGGVLATIEGLVIRSNEIYENGNMSQNQFGRGITASVAGNLTIESNYIHDNASAGSYVGGKGLSFSVVYARNFFLNNHLRGFGWINDGPVQAHDNTVVCNQSGLTCLGLEFGGAGQFNIHHNIIWLRPHRLYGAFIAIQQGAKLPILSHNIYWDASNGPGSRKFLLGDFRNSENYRDFSGWVAATGDHGSREIDPRVIDPGFELRPDFERSLE